MVLNLRCHEGKNETGQASRPARFHFEVFRERRLLEINVLAIQAFSDTLSSSWIEGERNGLALKIECRTKVLWVGSKDERRIACIEGDDQRISRCGTKNGHFIVANDHAITGN